MTELRAKLDAMSHTPPTTFSVQAVLLGQRIDTAGLERPSMVQSNPLVLREGSGFVALYRFGVIAFGGLTPDEQSAYRRKLDGRVIGTATMADSEQVTVEVVNQGDDRISPGGAIQMQDFSAERFVLVADALAKSVALARDEREINRVLDRIEPFANALAARGATPFRRRELLNLIGQALVAQQRVAGRVAVDEKPDILWDRPDLERLYSRLEDEYELKERAATLQHKLEVVVETARVVTDIVDTNRSERLEIIIILLIFFEILLSILSILKVLPAP
jgi:uncharacterized Rmd1/YagE family protein